MVDEMNTVRDLCKQLEGFREPPGQGQQTDLGASSSSSDDASDSSEASDPDVWKKPSGGGRSVPGYMRSKSARPSSRSGGGGAAARGKVRSSGYGQKKKAGGGKKAGGKKGEAGRRGRHADKPPYSETLPADAVDKELCEMIEREIVDFDAHVRWDDIAELTDAKRLLEEVRDLPVLSPQEQKCGTPTLMFTTLCLSLSLCLSL